LQGLESAAESFEVLVAGDCNDDQARGLVAASAGKGFDIAFLETTGANRSGKLNAACRAARGRILVFSDDDCVFKPSWLERLRECFQSSPEIGMVGGRDVLEAGGSAFDLALDCSLNSFAGSGGLRNRLRMRVGKYYPRLWNMAVLRTALCEVSGQARPPRFPFDERFAVHAEVDLAERIAASGKRIVYCPQIIVGHRRDTSFTAFFRRNFAMAQVSRRLGTHRLAHWALATFWGGLPVVIGASWPIAALRPVLAGLLTLYAVFLLVPAVQGGVRAKSVKVAAMTLALLIALHTARGIGYLCGAAAGDPVREVGSA
jgi:GT2 family glycosyltransferase